MARTALIVSYLYPPIAGMAPRRMCAMAEELVARDYAVSVLTCSPPRRHPKNKLDEKMLELISCRQQVFRSFPGLLAYLAGPLSTVDSGVRGGRFGLAGVRSLLGRLAKIVLLPDAKIDWAAFAVIKFLRHLRRERFSLIISHGYPATSHLVAYCLKRFWLRRAKWYLDYGEPWSKNHEHRSLPDWRRSLEYRLEQKCLNIAHGLIVNTEKTKLEYLGAFPALEKRRIYVVPSCFIRRSDYMPARVADRAKKMLVVYTGNFYERLQNPFPFFDALAVLGDINLEVTVAGEIERKYRDYVRDREPNIAVNFVGFQDREAVIQLQLRADVLLLFGAAYSSQVPSKIYEYMAARRPILCVRFDKEDVAADLVAKHNRGFIVDNDSGKIARTIENLYEMWKARSLAANLNLEELALYTQEATEERIEKLIQEIV